MKYISLLVMLFTLPQAFAAECKVYGISDSPQKMSCQFKAEKVSLTCVNGQYFLNSSKVSDAFHYEVEDGPVPLVFKAPDMQMVVVIHRKNNIEAELDRDGNLFNGKCRL